MAMRYCDKCRKTMDDGQFYSSHNLEKYPDDGKLNTCKKCLTLHLDNWNPDTYVWILQELDIPYVPTEWLTTLEKEVQKKGRSGLTGTSVLGRYISKMKLKQWKDYRWKDNEFLQELINEKTKVAMRHQGYENSEIARVIDTNNLGIITEAPPPPPPPPSVLEEPTEDYFARINDAEFVPDLSDEDRTYLRLKWGNTYRPEEWVKLEQLYEEMMNSYDIQAAGDKNTLMLACKCSLKANQLLDIGDMEGAQKATKMYDSLMKSGKWTAAQNKLEDNDAVDSIGELVAICERDGFIPKYYTAGPQDHVDRVIEDLKKYTSDLIEGESGLNIMMETAIKQILEENDRIREAANASEEDEEAKLFDYDNLEATLSDKDYEEFNEFEENLKLEDNELYQALMSKE